MPITYNLVFTISIRIRINHRSIRIPQRRRIPRIIPDRAAAAIAEPARVRMHLVGIHPAGLARCHHEAGEGEDVVGGIAQGPVLQLDGVAVVVLDLDILVWLALRRILARAGEAASPAGLPTWPTSTA